MKYVPLHVHSHYSLLDGLTKIPDLVAKAKEDGMPALALTDHGVMYGAVEFYQQCTKAGIKPIIGVEAYIVDDLRVKQAAREERFHLLLLAKNITGYRNLVKLTSIAHLEGFYYKPRLDYATLAQYSEGLLGCSACLHGEIPRAILRGAGDAEIKEIIEKYRRLFAPGDFYLEVQHHPNLPNQKIVNERVFALGRECDLEVVATTDTHYLNTEDADAHDILICLQTKKVVSDKDRMSYLGEDFSLFTGEQMTDFFRANPEVLENTLKVAEKCSLKMELGQIQLPHFDLPAGADDFEYLRKLCYDNLPLRYGFGFSEDKAALNEEQRKILERLEYELSVIKKTGYASYFLIVQDFIVWAKNNGVVVGPGRGSAAGSLVAYLTQITNLDPLKYDLLFERFLNPERVSMPDIDTDFADEKRDLVLRYVEERYGKDHVAGIITFGTMAARAAVKDVGRVLEMPYAFCDKIAKLIPMNMKLTQAVDKVLELKQLYDGDSEAKRLIDYAKKIEGVARHASVHACGVVITPKPLTEYCPVQYARDQEEGVVTQYSLHPVEDLGLLKMDFLGLKNLTIIARACEIIEAIHGKKLDMDNLPLDDEKTFRVFQEGRTTGVFQFESSGMKRYLKQLRPSNMEDLIAMVSLYRPGPMDLIPDYIARKHGRQAVTYIHPKLEHALAKTYGIAIYQEQIMQIARDLAGFTLGEADVLRKIIGKKIAALLGEQRAKFIKGCAQNGVDEDTAGKVFSFVEPFAGYGFNRSHAACYAFIAYQTAYLKANYPAEFMAALMTSDQHDLERIAIEIEECRELRMEVLSPDVNESFTTFAVVAESLKSGRPKLRFGLSAIRNVGESVARAILRERKARGPYLDLEDFLTRLSGQNLNKKSLEGLCLSGALDAFGPRELLAQNFDKMIYYLKETDAQKNARQTDLFSAAGGPAARLKVVLEESETITRTQLLSWEREFLGLYVSDHPFKVFQRGLADQVTALGAFKNQGFSPETARAAGVVTAIKKIMTKKGEPMLFVTIEDGFNSLELLVFPKVYAKDGAKITEGAVLVAEGAVSDKDEEKKILVDQLWLVDENNITAVSTELANKRPRPNFRQGGQAAHFNPQRAKSRAVLTYPVGADKEFARQVKMVLMRLSGPSLVYLKIGDQLVKTNFMIKNTSEARLLLEQALGSGTVSFEE